MEFTETDIRHLHDEDVDLSGGCEHIRQVADESGAEWETCHTSRTLSTINGIPDVEVYHDENASVYSCWKTWKKGFGSGLSAPSREEAISEFIRKWEAAKPCPVAENLERVLDLD